jgi:hypothetical protein
MTIWHVDDARRGRGLGTGRRGVIGKGVMGVVGLPMLGELSPGMLANVNDEDDQRDHPRRVGGMWSLGWVSRA